MQTVSSGFLTEFNSGRQALRYRVELLASSGFNWPEGVSASASASSAKNTYRGSGVPESFFAASNLLDGQAGEPIKYAVADLARTDKGFACAGTGAKYGPGWWSEVRSDSNGDFSTPPYVEISYSPVVEANRLRVSTTAVYPGAHTVNIRVRYQGEGSYTDLGDHAFGTGSRVVVTLSTGATLKLVAQVKVSVLKTKSSNAYARLTEVEPIVEWSTETLGTLEDYCESVEIRKSSGSITGYSPAAPGFGVNECNISLSKTCWVIPEENQLLSIYAGFNDELLPQGIYLISEVSESPDAWRVAAHGVLSLSRYHRYPDTVWRDVTLCDVIKRLLEWVGIAEDEIAFSLISNPSRDWYVVRGGDCDEAVRDAAEHFGAAIYEEESGTIRVRTSYGSAVMTITDDLIADISRTRPREINCVVVQYGNIREGQPDYVLSGSGELAASETKTLVFRYSKSPCLDVRPPVIESFKDANKQDLTLPTILSWAADAYSLTVTLHNNVAVAGTFAIKVWGTPLETSSVEALYEARDETSIRRRGLRPYETRIYTISGSVARSYGDALLRYLRYCSGALDLVLDRPAPHLQLRDVVRVQSSVLGIDSDYVIVGLDLGEGTRLELVPKEAVAI